MIKRKENKIDEILQARILYYDFFAGLFTYDLLLEREILLKEQIKLLKQEPIADISHFEAIENEINANGVKNLIFEYTYLFMLPFNPNIKDEIKEGLSRKKGKRKMENKDAVILYLSYYLDKTIAGGGLILAKSKVKKSKFRLNEKSFKENEEHFGFLLVFMKNLLQNNEFELFDETFIDCLKPMQDSIIEGLKRRKESLYSHIAYILESFLELESA
ncbi:MAG: hypothetical protein K2P17_02365 [Helicobacteraceae bacterium]|nr:hypothetical protein [Helicobacteraceae bacterium]